jgi:hypothetical protein
MKKRVKQKMKMGGKALKKVDSKKNPGLSKLPKEVRNKMGFMKRGGTAKKKMMRGGGMAKPKMMGGGMMKKRMKRGGKAK